MSSHVISDIDAHLLPDKFWDPHMTRFMSVRIQCHWADPPIRSDSVLRVPYGGTNGSHCQILIW